MCAQLPTPQTNTEIPRATHLAEVVSHRNIGKANVTISPLCIEICLLPNVRLEWEHIHTNAYCMAFKKIGNVDMALLLSPPKGSSAKVVLGVNIDARYRKELSHHMQVTAAYSEG